MSCPRLKHKAGIVGKLFFRRAIVRAYTNGSYTSRSHLGQSMMIATFSLGFGDSAPNAYSVRYHGNWHRDICAEADIDWHR